MAFRPGRTDLVAVMAFSRCRGAEQVEDGDFDDDAAENAEADSLDGGPVMRVGGAASPVARRRRARWPVIDVGGA